MTSSSGELTLENLIRPLALHLTGDGLVVISPDAVLPPSNLIAKNGAKLPVPGRAVVVSRMGCVEELGVEEAELVVEGGCVCGCVCV